MCRDALERRAAGNDGTGFAAIQIGGQYTLNQNRSQRQLLQRDRESSTEAAMKKLKHEAELFKGAMLAGVKYAEGRGVVEFEATDSASEKLLYIYRLLVHDKVIQPLPEDQVAEKTLRHKLALWYAKQLPKDHPLLQ
jgi:hypothetical protein